MIIIGLGNPGDKYDKTRHNIGRDCVRYFSSKYSDEEFKKDSYLNALVKKINIDGKNHLCVLPETYMNDSGVTIKELIRRGEEVGDLIVVHDELDLPFGKIKVSYNKNTGGHNGIYSIFEHIKSNEYTRIRIGISPIDDEGEISKIKDHGDVSKFVLSRFDEKERQEVEKINERVSEIIQYILNNGVESAMNNFNHNA